MTELKDKVVLITGSSSGIGQALAIRFAEEGSKIIVNYRQNEQGGKETIKKLEALEADCLLVRADVTKADDVERLFNETTDKFGTVDILINNAAIGTDKLPFMEADYESMKEMIDADLTSVLMCSQAAAKIMQKKGSGKIISTSSIRGWQFGGGTGIVYAATKGAVNSFTGAFAKAMAPKIQVNAVAPGFVKTRSYDDMAPDRIKFFLDQTYLKRWVTLDEICEAFVYLAKNDGVTGQVITVDAGYMLK